MSRYRYFIFFIKNQNSTKINARERIRLKHYTDVLFTPSDNNLRSLVVRKGTN